MAAAFRNFSHQKGFSPPDYIVINGADGNPIDIEDEGWTFEIRVKQSYRNNATLLETFSTANGKLVLDVVNTGRINFALDGTEFADVVITGVKVDFVYDFQGIDGDDVKLSLLEGNWTVRQNL